ncbi:MAG: hypothetical protein QG670_2713 [Thermoproteota archaeon]|nr:hypothetical protein [Thermoproteota archaeon]
MTDNLIELLADLQEEETIRVVRKRLEAGEDPLKILEDARKSMEIVGKRFADSEYFLPDLIYSGEILKRISEITKTNVSNASPPKKLGKYVIGTVAGDIHDIGKNIVVFMLDIHGFEVYDLGVDVPPQRFVEKIMEVKPQVVGLSGLLTVAFNSMKETVDAIKAAGLRDSVKIMVGGSQVDERVREYSGADAYAADAMEAVSLAKKWIESK